MLKLSTKCFQQQLGITEPVEERSRSPWTPSYSVTVLEPASALQNQVLANEEEFVEQGSFIIETQLTVRFYLTSNFVFAHKLVGCGRRYC
jgi:hypothetical protein